jgi:hypothetical protein
VDAAAALERMSADWLALHGSIANVIVDVGTDPASTCERVFEAARGFIQAA